VVPHVATVHQPQQQLPPGMPAEYGEPVEEEITEERMAALVRVAFITLPNVARRPWLATPEDDLQPFIHELTIYCQRHEIDPSEYVGDWLPLAITAVPLAAGIIERDRAHKRAVRRGLEISSTRSRDFDSSTGYSEPYTPVEKKTTKYDTGEGGDALPEEAEKKEEREEEIQKEEEDDTGHDVEKIDGGIETDVTKESPDEEQSIAVRR